MTSGIAAEDGLGAVATTAAGQGAPPTNAVLGGLRAPETLGPTVVTDRAEAMKMTSTEVLPVSTTEHSLSRAHEATLRPARLRPPDPGLKVKRASPGLTPRLKISTQPPAPRNSLRDGLLHAPTLDPCLDHALAPGPGLDASQVVTDSL